MPNAESRTENKLFSRLISVISIIYFAYYLWWRATSTLNPELPVISWALWVAEAFGVFAFILFSWITHRIEPMEAYKKPAEGLKVDLFVPTYNEELDVLEPTLIGCKNISYPHQTYVLDDGDRPAVRELANRLGCRYICRPVHDHAKAGNINYALSQSDGEFIVVLDADMVPQPDYLDRTLGYFEDEKLALVQLPQEFYNQDSIQHSSNKSTWHEQSLFFKVIQPGKNYTNSAFWCGSPSVVRRQALEEIGGVATETITEDIHSTVRMHARGWKTMYLNETLAYGIAPQTIKAFLVQRMRWAQGTMQLYRSNESPLWIPGLSIRQRLSYLSSFLAYFEAFQKLFLLTIPILIIGFNLYPMKVGIFTFALHWIPYFILNIVANQSGGRGYFRYFQTEKYNILKTVIFIQASFTLISKKPLQFKVTPKSIDSSVYQQERVSMRWFLAIFGTLVGTAVFALAKILFVRISIASWEMFMIALFWAGYNAFVIYLAIREVFSRRHERKQYRFPVQIPARLCLPQKNLTIAAKTTDLSVTGAGIILDGQAPYSATNLVLKLYPKDFTKFSIPVEKFFDRGKTETGKARLGVEFAAIPDAQRDLLFEYLFIYLPRENSSRLPVGNSELSLPSIEHSLKNKPSSVE